MADSRQAPKPLAEGSFSVTPFAHVLLNIYHRGQHGTLAVWPGPSEGSRGQDRILFANGIPLRARFLAGVASMESGLVQLFERIDAPYAFYEQDLVGSSAGVEGEADPYRIVARGLRAHPPPKTITDAVLGRFGAARLRFRAGAELARLSLEPAERNFVDVLRAEPAHAADLIASWGEPDVARSLLYLLVITRQVEPYEPTGPIALPRSDGERRPDAPRPRPNAAHAPEPAAGGRRSSPMPPVPHGNPPSAPPPPPDLPSELHARWVEITERARSIDTENYFEMLGIDRSAGSAAVRDAYFEQVKRFHPDRLPAEFGPLKPWVERIFQQVTEAKDTLSDEARRGPYVKTVQNGGGTPASDRKVQAIVMAALEFQKVEVLARRKSYREALDTLETAITLNPEEPEYLAMKGYLLMQVEESVADLPHALELADRALLLHVRSERAHLTRGIVLRRLGRHDEALEHFRRVVEINPKNIDAAREVRLAEMRAKHPPSNPSTPPPAGGIFSKLFKKKS